MSLELIPTLRELIAIPSVNPMGRALEGDQYFEHRLTDYLETVFERLGLPWQRQHVAPRRDNIIARLDGAIRPEDGGAVVLFEAHQDTVPVDGMTIEPFTPTVRDGRVYGRGSCDIKGGMAAMLSAIALLADERPPDMPTIIMACPVNEEYGFTGAAALTRLWLEPGSSIMPRRPDVAVVAEPTELNVVVAHKGSIRWRLRTHGRAAHSSQPHLGDNAVYKMASVLTELENYAAHVGASVVAHRLCGTATLNVGTIEGGISVNTVPDECSIEIDRRVLPGEDAATAYRHVLNALARAGLDFIEHEEPYGIAPPLPDDRNGALAARLSAAAQALGAPGELIGVPYGTDAAKYALAGVPSVVFGPGSIAQAHTADEWLDLAQLEKARDVLCEFARRGL